jgi:hypothetical protein
MLAVERTKVTFQEGEELVVLRAVGARSVVILSMLRSDIREVTISAGEVLVVTGSHPVDTEWVSFRPHRYEALEPDVVDPDSRCHPGYRGYAVVIDRSVVERDCAFIDRQR